MIRKVGANAPGKGSRTGSGTNVRRPTAILLALLALSGLPACSASGRSRHDAPTSAAPPPWEADNPLLPLPEFPLGVDADLAQVPFRVTPEKIRLGRWLFFDTRLSSDGTVSCATCHRPTHAFSEPTAVSTGVGGRKGTRKAPALVNTAFPIFPAWFWDGRAGSLQEQARGPMGNPVEMDMTHARVAETVRAIPGYAPYFAQAFGDPGVTVDRIAEAMAAYEATLVSGNSPYDRWDAGDPRALDPIQQKGFRLFFGRAACNECHLGVNLSDARFHNLGVGWKTPPPGADPASGFADRGRGAITGKSADTGAFKTPTLRDVSRHAPYMHDGSVATLRDVVLLYDRGGEPNPWLSSDVKPLGLTPDEVDALVAFLRALDGEGAAYTAPRSFPR